MSRDVVVIVAEVLEALDLVTVMQALIIKCIVKEVLCNEFYLQLIKQTTGTEFGEKPSLPRICFFPLHSVFDLGFMLLSQS